MTENSEHLVEKIFPNIPRYYFDRDCGLIDYTDGYGPAVQVYTITESDFFFDKVKNEIVLNIGLYADRHIRCMLERVLLPSEDKPDIVQAMKKENCKLVLVNRNECQPDSFFLDIYEFFKTANITPEYRGYWKPAI